LPAERVGELAESVVQGRMGAPGGPPAPLR
jgi:hypothetical protein